MKHKIEITKAKHCSLIGSIILEIWGVIRIPKILKLQLKTLNNFDSVNSILVKVGQSLTKFDQVNFGSVNHL